LAWCKSSAASCEPAPPDLYRGRAFKQSDVIRMSSAHSATLNHRCLHKSSLMLVIPTRSKSRSWTWQVLYAHTSCCVRTAVPLTGARENIGEQKNYAEKQNALKLTNALLRLYEICMTFTSTPPVRLRRNHPDAPQQGGLKASLSRHCPRYTPGAS